MKTTKEALDYLFEEYQKYAPTKMVEGIECFSKEGADWLDSIIIVKRTLEAYQKMEEELGIDFDTLFKAFSQGSCGVAYMFVQNDYNENYKKGLIKPLIINYLCKKPNEKSFQLNLYDSLTCKYYMVDTKDYGKTWALTKEELL